MAATRQHVNNDESVSTLLTYCDAYLSLLVCITILLSSVSSEAGKKKSDVLVWPDVERGQLAQVQGQPQDEGHCFAQYRGHVSRETSFLRLDGPESELVEAMMGSALAIRHGRSGQEANLEAARRPLSQPAHVLSVRLREMQTVWDWIRKLQASDLVFLSNVVEQGAKEEMTTLYMVWMAV
ncbi:MAG: hypothetical protein Q9205_003922 [Flavoplaca limonia]